MGLQPLTWVVALDGGTTNTRARLLHEGRVLATARRPVGVRDGVIAGSGADRLLSAVKDAIREVLAIAGGVSADAVVASGMLTSEVGLTAVPHVNAPAGLGELATGSVVVERSEVTDAPLLLIPGIRTPPAGGPDGWTEADVMRGEECETFGALAILGRSGPLALVWPGSHTKLVEVDALGRIVRSHTTLAGELTAVVARHTLLAASLPEGLPDDPDPETIAAGARTVAREGLGRAAFLVRVAALTGAMDAQRRAAFWVGASVAEDVACLVRHPILNPPGSPPVPLLVGGSRPLRGLYAACLAKLHPGPVEALGEAEAEHASALGALAVAHRRWDHPDRVGNAWSLSQG